MAKKLYHTHLVYILQEKENNHRFYIGSHNANRRYTEVGILSQSGNIYQRQACLSHDWDKYYNTVSLVHVIECNSESEALLLEQQLIDLFFSIFPEKQIMNKRRKANLPSHNYRYEHTDSWKESHSQKLQKPKAFTSLRGKKNVEYTGQTAVNQ